MRGTPPASPAATCAPRRSSGGRRSTFRTRGRRWWRSGPVLDLLDVLGCSSDIPRLGLPFGDDLAPVRLWNGLPLELVDGLVEPLERHGLEVVAGDGIAEPDRLTVHALASRSLWWCWMRCQSRNWQASGG